MANPTVRVGFLGDASQLARESRRAQESLDQVSRHAHTTSTALGTALGTVAGRGIGAIAGAARSAVGSVSELASTSIEAAGAMEESLHKNDRVFGSSAGVITAWAADSTKNILLTRQAAIEGAGGIGNLLTSWGVAQPEAAKLSTSLVGLAQDLSSFAHISTDDAFTALRSGLAGQARGLKQYGVDLSTTRVQAEAYALGLAKPVKSAEAIKAANVAVAAATAHLTDVQAKHGKGTLAAAQAQVQLTAANDRLKKAQSGQTATLSAAATVQARYSLIMKGTRTIQGDATRESGSYANATRILHKNIGDLEVSIGQKLLPHALALTRAISGLVKGFDNGTGAGGRLRKDLSDLGETARGIGDDLKPVVGVAQWFAEHPNAFKAAVEGMAAYAAYTKSAAIWSKLIVPVPPGVPPVGPRGVPPVVPVGGGGWLARFGLGAGAGPAVSGAARGAGGIASGIERIPGLPLPGLGSTLLPKLPGVTLGPDGLWHDDKGNTFDKSGRRVGIGLPKDTQTQADRDAEAAFLNHRHGRNSVTANAVQAATQAAAAAAKAANDRRVKAAADAAAAAKAAADKIAAGENYAADQADAIAKRKQAAADALQAATQKLQDALQSRLDTAKGVRDSLISSNSILRDGVSWTAKDLLARFTVTMGKVKRFQSAISSLVAKGFDPTIVSQVAAAGVQGGLGTAVGLAHASSAQVRQINATQRAINAASGIAGDRVASQMGPIQVTTNVMLNDKVLATAVNRWNARNGPNGSRLAA